MVVLERGEGGREGGGGREERGREGEGSSNLIISISGATLNAVVTNDSMTRRAPEWWPKTNHPFETFEMSKFSQCSSSDK